ncbi:hypothetical protein DFH29DRAFT_964018, partial [Suillus ampliporus]
RLADPVRIVIDKVVNPPSKKRAERSTPVAMDAAAQIAPKSYLGRAFEQIKTGKKAISKRNKRIDDSPRDSSSSSSESGSSTSDSSSSSSDSDDESSDSSSSSDTTRKGRKKLRSSSKKKSTLKPIHPAEYDGTVDSRAFHRFLTEGTTYVEDGNVPRKRRVFVLSHYLKGKAHDFYVRQVSDRPSEWRLDEFFTELFNYCFPLDFRTKQRKKLYRCYQGDKRVRDYLSELNKLWMMIGNVS